MILSYLNQGDFIGELGLFEEGQERSAWVRAKTACEVAEISYKKFRQLIHNKQPYVFEAVGPVKYTPLKQWIAHGEDSKYIVRRVKGGLNAEQQQKLAQTTKRYLGKPYDFSFSWSDQLEAGDVNFIKDFYYRLAHRVGELSHLADGSYAIAERWNLGAEYWSYDKNKLWSPFGYPVHHANEASAQVVIMPRSIFCARSVTCWWLYPALSMVRKRHVPGVAQR